MLPGRAARCPSRLAGLPRQGHPGEPLSGPPRRCCPSRGLTSWTCYLPEMRTNQCLSPGACAPHLQGRWQPPSSEGCSSFAHSLGPVLSQSAHGVPASGYHAVSSAGVCTKCRLSPQGGQACPSSATPLKASLPTFSTGFSDFSFWPELCCSHVISTGYPQNCPSGLAEYQFCVIHLLKTSCMFLASVDTWAGLTLNVNWHLLTVKPWAAA